MKLGVKVRIKTAFLESPVYIKDRGLNSLASNMIKLSVNETKWSSLLAKTRALILYTVFRFDYLISGRKSYMDLRETGTG